MSAPMPNERIAMLWNSLPLETDAQSVVAFVRAVEKFHEHGKPTCVDGAQAIERLRNGGQPDLAAKVELALSFAYAEGRKDEREAVLAEMKEARATLQAAIDSLPDLGGVDAGC